MVDNVRDIAKDRRVDFSIKNITTRLRRASEWKSSLPVSKNPPFNVSCSGLKALLSFVKIMGAIFSGLFLMNWKTASWYFWDWAAPPVNFLSDLYFSKTRPSLAKSPLAFV